ARRPIEAAEEIHQRRFAGAAGAHEGDEFALVDIERDTADGVNGNFPRFVDFVDVLDLDNRCHDEGGAKEIRTQERSAQRRMPPLKPPRLLWNGFMPPCCGPVTGAAPGSTTLLMTVSPSCRPSRTSVKKPSEMPSLAVTGSICFTGAFGSTSL